MFTYIEHGLLSYAQKMPLEVFVVIGSFIEEVVAPIPSPTIMLLSGTIAQLQGYPLSMLVMLAILGALGKVLGALVVYFVADKAENIIMQKCKRFFNVTHEEIERFGHRLGHGPRDYVLLTVVRALPFIPSVVVSVGSGLLKIPLPLFIVSTFLGTVIRDGVYLYAGYVGTEAFMSLINGSTHLETLIEIVIVLLVCAFLGYQIYKRKTNNLRSSM